MRIIGLLTSVVLTATIFALIWGNVAPPINDVDGAIWNVFAAAMGLFGYLFVQAAAAHSPPRHFDVWWALDIIFSVLPLFTAVVALVANWQFGLALNAFQQAFVFLSLTATLIDLSLIYAFARDQRRPQPDAHPLRDTARR